MTIFVKFLNKKLGVKVNHNMHALIYSIVTVLQ